jgi:hypothetical protein
LPHFKKNLLSYFFGLSGIAQNATHQTEHSRRHEVIQLAKGALISRSNTSHKLVVVRRRGGAMVLATVGLAGHELKHASSSA